MAQSTGMQPLSGSYQHNYRNNCVGKDTVILGQSLCSCSLDQLVLYQSQLCDLAL